MCLYVVETSVNWTKVNRSFAKTLTGDDSASKEKANAIRRHTCLETLQIRSKQGGLHHIQVPSEETWCEGDLHQRADR